MSELEGFRLTHLHDDGAVSVFRGQRSSDGAPVLVVTPRKDVAVTMQRLDAFFAARGRYEAAWSLYPIDRVVRDDRLHLVLRDPGGVPVTTLTAEGIPDPVRGIRIAVAIADAIAQLHAGGMLHGDIRPSTIFVEPDGGQAWLAGLESSSLALPHVAAPPAFDVRSDLFALGAVLQRLITGELPRAVTTLIAKLCAASPDDRYQSAAGVREDLRGCLAMLDRRTTSTPAASMVSRPSVGASEEVQRLYAELRRVHAYMAHAERIGRMGSLSWNLNRGAVFWSDEIHRIYETDPTRPPDVAVARSRVHPDDIERVDRTVLRAMNEGVDLSLEYRIVMPDGREKCVLLDGSPLHDPDGRSVEYVGALRDVTEQRLAEQALQTTRAALTHVARIATLGEMAAAIAHEMTQPISAGAANAGAALRWLKRHPPVVDEALEAVTRARRDAERAGEVVGRIRASFRKPVAIKTPVDLNDAVEEVVALTRSEVAKYRALVDVDLHPDLPHPLGARVQIQQVLVNLVLNSAEAMSEIVDRPRRLSIRTIPAGERARVEVEDAGPGIEPADAARIFHAFHTTKAKGMGMGLAVSRSIAMDHGGTLEVVARDGPGALFALELPVAPG